jgi:hypothetical protein
MLWMRGLGFMLAWRLARRVRPLTLALAVYRTWRRLPVQQRHAILVAARRNAPLVVGALAKKRRY